MEEKKLGLPFSENGPSAIQGEGATLAFSDLREWEERGVTTPNVEECGDGDETNGRSGGEGHPRGV